MSSQVKFIVMSTDEQFSTYTRSQLLSYEGVKVVAEVDEPALISQAVDQFPVDILLINLDPSPESVLPLIGDVASSHPELSIFATSESTDGPLILKAMRLGIKEFLPKPIDEKQLVEAIERVASTRVETVSQGSLITIMGAAGGVGATAIATNLAIELAALSHREVTAVDLDYRYGQIATMLDIDPTYTLADVCGSPEQLDSSVMQRAMTKHDATGVYVLSRPSTFAEADMITAAACVGVFSTLLQMNSYVVADGPTRFDSGAKSLLSLSDVNLLVMQLSVPCVRNALRIIQNLREEGFNLDRIKVVCNRAGRDATHLTVENVKETLGLEVFAQIPDDWSTVSGAINLGEPLSSYAPKSKVRTAIQEMAHDLATEDEGEAEHGEQKKGLIGRIFAAS